MVKVIGITCVVAKKNKKELRNFKAKISKLEKNIKPRKKLHKAYWADGTFVGKYWV